MIQLSKTRAVVVDTAAPGRLVLRDVPLVAPMPDQATVRVTAISLNRGEVKRALTAMGTGDRPGWDFVGVVERPAEDGGPGEGDRVVGLLQSGAWAERVQAPLQSIATLPDEVTDAQAATLPVAGLTALHALRKGGLLLGRKVLIDGASGGVGHLAVQIAAMSGAIVHAHVRRADQVDAMKAWGADVVVVGEHLNAARSYGPFHLIVDSVGGSALGTALGLLERGGTCVTLGVSEGSAVTFDSATFFRTTGVSLYGLMLFDEFTRGDNAAHGLALLARLVARGALRPAVEVEAPWTEVASVSARLMDRAFGGKAVLHVVPAEAVAEGESENRLVVT